MLTLQEHWDGLLKLWYFLIDVYIDGFAVHYKYKYCWEVESRFHGFGITLLPEKPVKSLLVALDKQNIISGYWWEVEDIVTDCL